MIKQIKKFLAGKITAKFVMKNGVVIPVRCDNIKRTVNLNNELTSYEMTGIEGDPPLYIRLDDVSAILIER